MSSITINGKQYRYAFSMLQIENNNKLAAKQDSDIAKGACSFYTAIEMAARQDKVPLDVTFEDVLLWYDTAFGEDNPEIEAFNVACKESVIYKKLTKLMEESSESSEKKS